MRGTDHLDGHGDCTKGSRHARQDLAQLSGVAHQSATGTLVEDCGSEERTCEFGVQASCLGQRRTQIDRASDVAVDKVDVRALPGQDFCSGNHLCRLKERHKVRYIRGGGDQTETQRTLEPQICTPNVFSEECRLVRLCGVGKIGRASGSTELLQG